MIVVLHPRDPFADKPYWPGRVGLAVLDALAWAALPIVLLLNAPFNPGVMGSMIYALAGLNAVFRVHTAICENKRYRFMTWRVGKVIAMLMLVGLIVSTLTKLDNAGPSNPLKPAAVSSTARLGPAGQVRGGVPHGNR